MFDFIKTTVINSAIDTFSGKPKYSVIDTKNEKCLNIKRFGKFEKECIMQILHKAPVEATNAKFVYKLAGLTKKGDYVLSFKTNYYGDYPAEQSNYDCTFGRTFNYEIKVLEDGEDVSKIMARLKKIINVYKQLSNSEEFSIEVGTDTVTFTAKSPYMSFQDAYISKYSYESGFPTTSVVEELIIRDPATGDYKASANGSTYTPNDLGFGTYMELLTSVQLPTENNQDIWGPNSEMRPVAGAKYHQYIINYYKNRGVLGMSAVGQDVNTITQHVIWVIDSLNSEFSALLGTLGATVEETDKASAKDVKPVVSGPTLKGEKTKNFTKDE